MNLDSLEQLQAIDKSNILARIDGLPKQFEGAWLHAQQQPLPEGLARVKQIVITGMGGSAIGGDLFASLAARNMSIPVSQVRGYDLPLWFNGKETLVIASSFSGNTEETLAAYDEAHRRGTQIIGMTTGGKLAQLLAEHGHTTWRFEDPGPPRAALGWGLGLLLGLAARAGWMSGVAEDVAHSVVLMEKMREHYQMATPAVQNPAKRQGGQVMGRIPVIIGGGVFETVARRWKSQINEYASAWAVYEPMPEMNHNAVVGIEHPAELLRHQYAIFITSPEFDHPRIALRHKLTAELFMQQGIMTDTFVPQGQTLLQQVMHAILYGDYMSYYTAIGYGADPMLIEPIIFLKEAMAQS